MIKKIWKDPVGSKLIAIGLAALISTIIAWIKSIIEGISLQESIKSLIDIKIPLIYVIISSIILIIISKRVFTKKENLENMIPDFRDYKKDKFDSLEWQWSWGKDPFSGKWNIQELKPSCNKCGTALEINHSGFDRYGTCPRCDNRLSQIRDPEKIEAVIIDNIKRDIYLDKI